MKLVEKVVWCTIAAATLVAIGGIYSRAGAAPVAACGEILADTEPELFAIRCQIDNERVSR